MISLEDVDRQIFRISDNNPENFVAAAVFLHPETGNAYHSGLLISYNGSFQLFHYTSTAVELLETTSSRGQYKKIEFIKPEEVLAFLAHCRVIQETAQPQYGYFFTGDYYKDGVYFSDSGLEEYMTCVGFCISVVKGYIEGKDYYIHEDWSDENVPEHFFEQFLLEFRAKNPDKSVDTELFKKYLRRITPTEFTTGAFLPVPVRKVNVDEIVGLVAQALDNRHTPRT